MKIGTRTAIGLLMSMAALSACTSTGAMPGAPSSSPGPAMRGDGAYRGTSVTQGGSKDFCKGSGPLTAQVSNGRISVEVPLAVGGTTTVSGRIDETGSVRASGGRFTFTGTSAAQSITGNWKGPSCYGTWSFRRSG